MGETPMPSVRSLRRQVEAWEALRDVMVRELCEDEYEALGEALAPIIDRTLHALAKAEQGDAYMPYPHPIGAQWWEDFPLPITELDADA